MPGSHRASEQRINVFRVSETYQFKHYFEDDHVFDRLKRYYSSRHYRFEVSADEFAEVRAFLSDHGFCLVEVETPEEFVVVVEKYSEHPDDNFRDCVLQRADGDHNVFLLTDQAAVEQAVHQGATRITETDLAVPF